MQITGRKGGSIATAIGQFLAMERVKVGKRKRAGLNAAAGIPLGKQPFNNSVLPA